MEALGPVVRQRQVFGAKLCPEGPASLTTELLWAGGSFLIKDFPDHCRHFCNCWFSDIKYDHYLITNKTRPINFQIPSIQRLETSRLSTSRKEKGNDRIDEFIRLQTVLELVFLGERKISFSGDSLVSEIV